MPATAASKPTAPVLLLLRAVFALPRFADSFAGTTRRMPLAPCIEASPQYPHHRKEVMIKAVPGTFVTLLLAACGGGSDSPSAVSSNPPAPTAQAPAAQSPAVQPPTANPAPPPVVVAPPPPATPVPSPTPVAAPVAAPGAPPAADIRIGGGYPTVATTCAAGTPMVWARPWTLNYNGGVLRFTPVGEVEQIVILETSNGTTQQHENGATFSAPTNDGRQGWFSIDRSGTLIGGGFHGATPDSYLRCGAAMDGVAAIGPVDYRVVCQGGTNINGEITPGRVDIGLVRVDASRYPWRTLSASGTDLVTDETGARLASPDSVRTLLPGGDLQQFVGGPANWDGSYYTLRAGRLVEARRNGRMTITLPYVCQVQPQ